MFQAFDKKIDKDEADLQLVEEIDDDHVFNLDKYNEAGRIAELALGNLKTMIVSGNSTYDMCIQSDAFILAKLSLVYRDTFFTKGIGFPTCVSVNNAAGYHSPLTSDTGIKLEDGMMVKVELGVHIDGFLAIVGDTVMLGEANPVQTTVLNCLSSVKSEIKSFLRIGNDSDRIQEFITSVVNKSGCSLLKCTEAHNHCPGTVSSQIGQFVIDGFNEESTDNNKHHVIYTGHEDSENYIEDDTGFVFEHNNVFVIDIALSSGSGNVVVKDNRETSIYRSNAEYFTNLRLMNARKTLNKLREFEDLPCNIREFNTGSFKLGLTECIGSDVVDRYPVLYEHGGEYIGNYKFTVILRRGNKKKKHRNIVFG
jgi:methionine aminopeptidase